VFTRRPIDQSGRTEPDPITQLLGEMHARPIGDPDRTELRRQAIELGLPAVRRIAHRFAGRGEPTEDLIQVGAVGLINAVDRFDPTAAGGFWPYATATITGELRRHFRDKSWTIRVPRRLQETWLEIRSEADGLVQRLGRHVDADDLAQALDLDRSLVVEARIASRSHTPRLLSAPVSDGAVLGDLLAVTDDGYEHVDNRLTIHRALLSLPIRMRHVVRMRFRNEMSQAEIAAAIGMSQMHVSRILAEALSRLRDIISADSAPVESGVTSAVATAPSRRTTTVQAVRAAGVRDHATARPFRTRISPTTTG
jgi:RNA polymerase sigma-B factor